jgi:hypothetical protein
MKSHPVFAAIADMRAAKAELSAASFGALDWWTGASEFDPAVAQRGRSLRESLTTPIIV